MAKVSSNHIFGKLGELELMRELELQGFPTVDISARDYGVDLSSMIPEQPLRAEQVRDLRNMNPIEDFKVTARFLHVQVKSGKQTSLDIKHLAQWSSAIEKGAVIIVAFVRRGEIHLYDGDAILDAYNSCMAEGLSSISMKRFEERKRRLIATERRPENYLGLFLFCSIIGRDLYVNLDSILEVKDWATFQSFVFEHYDIFANTVFKEYPAGRDLDHELEHGLDGIRSIVGRLLQEFIVDFGLNPDGHEIHELETEILGELSSEYQGPKYTREQVGDAYFRESPSINFESSLELLHRVIKSVF